MIAIVILVFLLHLYLSFKRPQWGFCSLLAIKILIPDNVRFPVGNISLNVACALVLFGCWLIHRRANRKANYTKHSICTIVGAVVAYSAFNMLLTDVSVPVFAQFKPFFAYVVLQLLPVIVMINCFKKKEDVLLLVKVFVTCSAICAFYSLTCFFLQIPYPYNNFVNSVYPGRDEDMESVLSQVMGDVMGRCMGTATSGTYDYGMVISMLFTGIGVVYHALRKKWILIVWIMVGVDVLCTTRRAPIVTMMAFLFILFFFSDRKKLGKKLAWLAGIVGFAIAAVFIFPQLSSFRNILEASLFFWDDSVSAKNDVSGSSVSFRVWQLKQTLTYIAHNPLFGNGWGSCYYNSKYPAMNGWESFVLTTLMQFGYLGMVIWSLLYYKFYKFSLKGKMPVVSLAFMVSAAALLILTDTIYPFYIYYGAALIYTLGLLKEQDNKKA